MTNRKDIDNQVKPRVCILARKRLGFNARIFKQAKTLAYFGYDVSIIALAEPGVPLEEHTVEYRVHRIQLDPLDRRARRMILRPISLILRGRILFPMFLKKCYFALGGMIREDRVKKWFNRLRDILSAFFLRLKEWTVKIAKSPLAPFFILKRFLLGQLRKREELSYRLKTTIENNIFTKTWRSLLGIKRTIVKMRDAFFTSTRRFFISLDFFVKAFSIIRRHRADVCLVHDSYPLLVGYVVARLHKTKLIYDAVEFSRDRNVLAGRIQPLRNFSHIIESYIIRRADAIVTIGEGLACLIQKAYRVPKPTIVMNCPSYRQVPHSDFLSRALRLDKKIILYAGSVTHNNGLEELIKAASFLRDSALVVIIGPTTSADFDLKLKRLIAKEGVSEKVVLFGPVKKEDVIDYMASAYIGVIPIQNNCLNHLYALPNKLFEHIMARCPIASSNLPDIRTVLDRHKMGVIFNERSPEDIADSLNKMLDDPAYYEAMKSNMEEAAKTYCWENESEKLLHVFDRLLQRKTIQAVDEPSECLRHEYTHT